MVAYSKIYSNLIYDKTIRTKVATYNSELYYQYLRLKYSIVQNLSRPAVKKIDNHLYYSVKKIEIYLTLLI